MKIVAFAGSTRSGSLNAALARHVSERLRERGEDATFLDLADYPMPLYNGDLEERDGVPASTHDLATEIQDADALFIASPEYNGAITPLLKNTIDWITRIDKGILAGRPILIGAATPGKTGGVNGMKVLRLMFDHMGLDTLDDHISIPHARDAIVDGRVVDPAARDRVDGALDMLLDHGQQAKAA